MKNIKKIFNRIVIVFLCMTMAFSIPMHSYALTFSDITSDAIKDKEDKINAAEEQKKALAVIKKGRDGFEIKPHDKMKALEMLGRHLGLWDKKPEADDDEKDDDGFMEALQSEAKNVWDEE